jgi:hypothetical protein
MKSQSKFLLTLTVLVVAVLFAGTVFAQALPGGTLDPTTIPKYVTPLVIPPERPTFTTSR